MVGAGVRGRRGALRPREEHKQKKGDDVLHGGASSQGAYQREGAVSAGCSRGNGVGARTTRRVDAATMEAASERSLHVRAEVHEREPVLTVAEVEVAPRHRAREDRLHLDVAVERPLVADAEARARCGHDAVSVG